MQSDCRSLLKFNSCPWWVISYTTYCDIKVWPWIVVDGTPFASTNKTDHHITEIWSMCVWYWFKNWMQSFIIELSMKWFCRSKMGLHFKGKRKKGLCLSLYKKRKANNRHVSDSPDKKRRRLQVACSPYKTITSTPLILKNYTSMVYFTLEVLIEGLNMYLNLWQTRVSKFFIIGGTS